MVVETWDKFYNENPVTACAIGLIAALCAIAAVGGAIGGAMGWAGGKTLDAAGYELDDADSFGYVGLIGGAEVAIISVCSLIGGRSSFSGSSNWTHKDYFLAGLAITVFTGFVIGLTGMSQTLEFSDTLMSNLEQNEKIWTSGTVCATGATVLYLGFAAIATAGYKLYEECPKRLYPST